MERASRVSSASQGRGKKVLDTDWRIGRCQGLGGQSSFKELQEKEFEGGGVKPGCAAGKAGQSPSSSSWGPHTLPQGGSGARRVRSRGQGLGGGLCQWAGDMSCVLAPNSQQPQKIVPRPVPSHGGFLFLFFNIVIILFNWTSGS